MSIIVRVCAEAIGNSFSFIIASSVVYQSKLPLYEQIADRFRTLILRGVLPPRQQMPSVRSLAVELSINPNTIQKAYALLEQEGYIYPVRGRGNYVADVTALAEKSRQKLLAEAEQLILSGKEMGITRSEYISVIDRLYREGDTDD